MSGPEVLERLAAVRASVEAACARAGRDPSDVRLVAVTKHVAGALVAAAAEAGVTDFGENYVRELEDKREAAPHATWHFVGTLQSHTAHRVADAADVVQTLAPGRAVERLAARAARRDRALRCLVQVDFTGRRHGAAPEKVAGLLDATSGLDVRGLMTLPPQGSPEEARAWFRRLRGLRDSLRDQGHELPELSMGMSADYEVAVEEGATMIRVGTALFGARPA